MADQIRDAGDAPANLVVEPKNRDVGDEQIDFDRTPDGKLTRRGMLAALAAGQPVRVAVEGGKHVTATRPEHLPTEAQMAKGDSAAEAAARENLLRQREAIDRQIATLAPPKPAPADLPAEPFAEADRGKGPSRK
jgi:hypothetical protein